jgi:hypothetical protein
LIEGTLTVAAWRRKAVALFPELCRGRFLSRGIWASNNFSSVYHLWFDLLPLTIQAHEANDKEFLKKVYGYAEWSFRLPNHEIWNAVGVSFYEHLVDHGPDFWPQFLPWIAQDIRNDIESLWDWRLEDQPERLKMFKQLMRTVRDNRSKDTVYATGAVQAL